MVATAIELGLDILTDEAKRSGPFLRVRLILPDETAFEKEMYCPVLQDPLSEYPDSFDT